MKIFLSENHIAPPSNSRKFSDALQKASQIEDIMTRTRSSFTSKEVSGASVLESTPLKKSGLCDEQSSPSSSSNNSKELNSDEFKFFLSAIEKLKATHLFHDQDLKRMTDEQIYNALIEHVKKQQIANNSNSVMNAVNSSSVTESIDKEQEEDLPIIMRNLHSVKSLKHFFEIRAKANSHCQSKFFKIDFVVLLNS